VIEACLLPGLVGWGNTADLVLTGDVIDAQRALRIGFVQRLVESDELEAETRRVLDSLLAAGAGAVRAQKRIIRGWERLTEADAIEASIAEFAAIYGTPEPGEMMRPFLEKKRGH